MYLLDTNIWLERLLGQAHSEENVDAKIATQRQEMEVSS